MSVHAVFKLLKVNVNFNKKKQEMFFNSKSVSEKPHKKLNFQKIDIEKEIKSIEVDEQIQEISKNVGEIIDLFG